MGGGGKREREGKTGWRGEERGGGKGGRDSKVGK